MKTFTPLQIIILMGLLLNAHLLIGQTGNYFAGFQTGTGNTGSYNALVGYQSGVSANTGWYNTFLGYQTGYLNKGGSYNTFVGSFAGYDNTTGLSNTFVGWAAGSNNTTASSNSFFGNLSGYQNTTGGSNSFFGSATAYSNTTGSNNAFFGNRAGYNNTTASHNTYMGFSAGEKTTTGNVNTFVGSQAGFTNTTGNNNAFIGYQAGYATTTGASNAFLGSQAGRANTTGASNTYIGRDAGLRATTGNNNVMLGRGAGFNATTGSSNTFVGKDAGYGNTTGTGNTFLGFRASMPTSQPNLTNATAIGHNAQVNISNAVVIGSVNGVNSATANARVGIGTNAPGYRFHVNASDAAKVGGGSWVVASDKRLKKEIQPFTEGLAVLEQINPVWFRYNGKAGIDTDQRFVGIIAQDMQQIAPYTVGEFTYVDSTGTEERYLDYDASALAYLLVNAVKEQQQQLAEKDAQLQAQQQQIDALRQEMALIKALITKQNPEPDPALARLWQNEPNPYTQTTTIRYFVPETAGSAQLKVFSVKGQEVFSQELRVKGAGEVRLSSQLFASGTYVYHLIVDGKAVDSKKLVLTR